MIIAAYALYIWFVALALYRGRKAFPGRSRTIWLMWAIAMVILPAFGTAGLTLLLTSSESHSISPGLAIVGGYVVGALLFLIGVALGRRREYGFGLSLRCAGWSIAAGITLIPATIVLLAPLAGLLAFWVLPSRPRLTSVR